MSEVLKSVKSKKVHIDPLCDMLKLHARTSTYFTTNDNYKKSRGLTIQIRNCDVRHKEGQKMDKYSQGEKVHEGEKEYDCQYIWG